MPDLELVPVRFAPRASTAATGSVTVQVIEPEDSSSTRLALPERSGKDSSSSFRIPRRPLPPPEKRPLRRLSKKKASVLADKVNKRERKANKKKLPRAKRFCKLCRVSCNSAAAFYDHVHSRSHLIQVENHRETPLCTICDRVFEAHHHLSRHKNSAAHFKVICKKNSQ